MSDTHETFSVHVEHLQGFEFKLRYDWPGLDETVLDEPEPLGHEKGPNASRLVAAAVGWATAWRPACSSASTSPGCPRAA